MVDDVAGSGQSQIATSEDGVQLKKAGLANVEDDVAG